MERVLKESTSRNSSNARCAVQRKSLRDSAQGGIASRINDSPLMVAQRRKLQSLFGSAAQLEEASPAKPNQTGLPDNLKSGIESLSGLSMDHVRVHYNSSMPAQLNAYAYTQGGDIHVAPGQEKHLPHEAWHVVQQAQGRVQPTMQVKGGVPVNDDKGLEREADVMGGKALQMSKCVPIEKQHNKLSWIAEANQNGMAKEATIQKKEVTKGINVNEINAIARIGLDVSGSSHVEIMGNNGVLLRGEGHGYGYVELMAEQGLPEGLEIGIVQNALANTFIEPRYIGTEVENWKGYRATLGQNYLDATPDSAPFLARRRLEPPDTLNTRRLLSDIWFTDHPHHSIPYRLEGKTLATVSAAKVLQTWIVLMQNGEIIDRLINLIWVVDWDITRDIQNNVLVDGGEGLTVPGSNNGNQMITDGVLANDVPYTAYQTQFLGSW